MRPPPALLAAAGVVAGAAVVYPFVVWRALEPFGPRPVAAGLLAAGALTLALPTPSRELALPGRGQRAALLVLPAAAAASGDLRFLLLVPAAIQALLAVLFARSLRGGGSLLQQAARYLHPYAPDFIGPYCRRVTVVFAAILGLQAAGLAALALHPPEQGWAWLAGVAVWAPLALASAVEWAVRKAWFRYYGPGPVDRRLRRLLPPEKTAAGRRSLAYIRRMRRELGMPPP